MYRWQCPDDVTPQISILGSFLIQRQGHFCIKSYRNPQRRPCTCMVWLCKLLIFGLKERTMWKINCLGARKSRSEDYKKLALLLWSTIFHCSVWWYWCSLSKLNFGNKYTRFHLCCFSILVRFLQQPGYFTDSHHHSFLRWWGFPWNVRHISRSISWVLEIALPESDESEDEFDKYTWEQIDRMEQMMGVYTFGLVIVFSSPNENTMNEMHCCCLMHAQ